MRSEDDYKKLEEEYFDYYYRRITARRTFDITQAIAIAEAEQQAKQRVSEIRQADLQAEALEAQQAKLDNRTESVDVSGGKENDMRRGTVTILNGQKRDFTGHTLDELAQKAYNAGLQHAKEPEPEQSTCNYTFKEWAEQLKNDGKQEETKDENQSYLKVHLYPYFGDKCLSTITHYDCQTFADNLARNPNIKRRTAKGILEVLKNVFKTACDAEIIKKNPAHDVINKNPKGTPKDAALTTDEIKRLSAILPMIAEENIQLIWAICIATGIRTGELRALRWENLKTDREIPYFEIKKAVKHNKKTPDGLPIVGAPKTDNGIRDVPIMHSGALEIIMSAKQDSGYIIKPVRDSGKKERPLSEQQMSRLSKTFNDLYWKPATEQDRLTPYDFRKTILTVFNNAGVTEKSSHTMAGHADEDFTQRTYVSSSWEQIVIDAKKVMKWFDEVTK